jgi:hypothetical protein
MLKLCILLAVALFALALAPNPSRADDSTIRLAQAQRAEPIPTPGSSRPVIVWVNTASGVYHCPGDRWYGNTKRGEYMTEAEAKARGNRPDHYRPCR